MANLLHHIQASEENRQSVIRGMIDQEVKFVADIDLMESLFIRPLEKAAPSLIKESPETFIADVFYNILDLRNSNRNLLERLRVRQHEQHSVVSRVGDIFIEAVTEFHMVYPQYVGHLHIAEKRLDEEMKNNDEFRTFLEVSRHTFATQ
jgi:hypothetical protein